MRLTLVLTVLLHLSQQIGCKMLFFSPVEGFISKAQICPGTEYLPIKLQMKLLNDSAGSHVQRLYANLSLPFNLDSTVGLNVRATRLEGEKTIFNAINLEEGDACKFANRFLGGLWVDLQTRAGLQPGKCPLPKGNYTIQDVPLDLSRIKYQIFKLGKYRVETRLVQNFKTLICIRGEMMLNAKKS